MRRDGQIRAHSARLLSRFLARSHERVVPDSLILQRARNQVEVGTRVLEVVNKLCAFFDLNFPFPSHGNIFRVYDRCLLLLDTYFYKMQSEMCVYQNRYTIVGINGSNSGTVSAVSALPSLQGENNAHAE